MNKLTNRTRYRCSLFGKLILQVEELRELDDPCPQFLETRTALVWRDAVVTDLPFLSQQVKEKINE